MSDFDENDLVTNDFDEQDLAPAKEDNFVEAREPASQDDVGNATRGLMGGATGAAAGYGVDKLGKFVGDKAMSLVGDLSPKEIQKISDNRDIYKNVSPLDTMLEEFRNLADNARKGGIEGASKAREALKDVGPIPVKDFYRTLSKPAVDPKLSNEIAPEKAQQLLEDELDKMYPTLDDKQVAAAKIDEKIANIENQISTPYSNPKADIRQEAKDAKLQNKLEQIDPKLTTNAVHTETVDEAGDTFKDKKISRQVQRLDEDMKEIKSKIGEQPKAVKQLEKIQKRKEDLLYNQANAKEKDNTTRDVRNTKQFEAAQNRKTQLELNKIIEDETQIKLKAQMELEEKQRLYQELKNLQDKKQHLVKQAGRAYDKAATNADKSLENIKRAPREIREVAPFLENRSLDTGYAQSLQDAVSKVEGAEKISPERLDQIIQELREGNINYNQSGAVNNFNKSLSSELSGYLKELSPGYAEGMERSSKGRDTEALYEKLGIRFDDKLDRTTLEQSARQRISNILLDPEKYKEEYGYLQEALKDSEKYGDLMGNPDDLIREAETSALKEDVANLREGKRLSSFEVDAVTKADPKRAAGIMSKLGGTRLQELYGLYKDSKAANALKGVSKVGLTGAGALFGGMAASEAAERGEISPSQATAATLAESINPIPLTDSVASVKAGNDAYNEALQQGDDEAIASLKAAGGATAGFFKPVTDALGDVVPAVDQGLESLYKGFKNTLNATGMEQANAARSRMEQNFKAAEPKFNEEFKNFVEQKPEQIADLASLFAADPSAQAFVAPLEKAAQGDNRTRSAVLFGLYQQPAFRQALKTRTK